VGCSTRDKNEYQNALVNIKNLIQQLRDKQTCFQNTPNESKTHEFYKSIEQKLLDILNIGKDFLQNKIAVSDFSSSSDDLKTEMETNQEEFTKLIHSKEEVKTNRRGLERQPTVNDVEFVMDTYSNLKSQKDINEDLTNKIKEALMQISGLQDKHKKKVLRNVEEKNSAIMSYQIELNSLKRTQKDNEMMIKSHREELGNLIKKIDKARSKTDNSSDSEKLSQLIKLLHELRSENEALGNKVSILENEMQLVYNKVVELTHTLSSNVKNSLITNSEDAVELKEKVQGLLKKHKIFESELGQLREKERELTELTIAMQREIKKKTKKRIFKKNECGS